jgi:hypothetical protein
MFVPLLAVIALAYAGRGLLRVGAHRAERR